MLITHKRTVTRSMSRSIVIISPYVPLFDNDFMPFIRTSSGLVTHPCKRYLEKAFDGKFDLHKQIKEHHPTKTKFNIRTDYQLPMKEGKRGDKTNWKSQKMQSTTPQLICLPLFFREECFDMQL